MKKNLQTILFMLLILLIGNKIIYAQEKVKSYEISLGISHLKIKNKNFSPMLHKGRLFFTSLSFITETPKSLDITYFQFNSGKIHLGSIESTDATSSKVIGGAIDWVHVRTLNSISTENNSFFLGGVFNISYTHHKRISPIDDDAYYLGQISIGPAFHFRHPFEVKHKHVCFETQINSSLLAYAVYPSYSSIMPNRLLEKDADDISKIDYVFGGKIVTVNKFQRINYMASITYGVSSRVSLKLNYNWELINVIQANNFTKVNHNILLTLIIK